MLEQNNQSMQDQLGFRIVRTNPMGEPGCQVVFVGGDGRDASVHPVAGEWPWALWEHLREVYLLLGKKDSEIAELRALAGKTAKKTHITEEGDIVVRSSLVGSDPTESASDSSATEAGS